VLITIDMNALEITIRRGVPGREQSVDGRPEWPHKVRASTELGVENLRVMH
jgi:hypothetical protein